MAVDQHDEIPSVIKELEKFDILAILIKKHLSGIKKPDRKTSFDKFLESLKTSPLKKNEKEANTLFDVNDITEVINEGLSRMSAQIQLLWVHYQQLLSIDVDSTMHLLKIQYEYNIKEKVK